MLILLPGFFALLSLIFGFAGIILVIIGSFKKDWRQGLLCLFVPLYMFYYGAKRYESDRRKTVLAMLFGGWLMSFIFQAIGWALRN
jgi:uncharacterized membrane protein